MSVVWKGGPSICVWLWYGVLLLQARTCANYNPITNPGELFECPSDTEWNPAAGNKTNPDVERCCKVRGSGLNI